LGSFSILIDFLNEFSPRLFCAVHVVLRCDEGCCSDVELAGASLTGSVFLGQQDARTASFSFGDNPELHVELCSIRTQQATAILERLLVGFGVFLAHISPITTNMTIKEVRRSLSGLLNRFQ